MSVVIKNIKKKFGEFFAVNDVSFEVKEGEFVALLGPSGSGKTTLLRIISGLELPDQGEIFLQGEDAQGKPIVERKMGFVFQHFALFKHMSVFENIAFGLRLKRPKLSKEQISLKVQELLTLVHLKGMAHKQPSELSGGQRQRIALARVLAIEPKYMLLDEPFGALDSKVRKELRRWLRKLHDTAGLTTIFVTHDQEEAMEISDRIVILNQGKLAAIGTPYDLWEKPSSSFVFDFLGNYNVFYACKNAHGDAILKEKPEIGFVKFFSRPHETIFERNPIDPNHYIKVKLTLINRAGPYAKTEAESFSGVTYQVDMEKSIFDSLHLEIGENLWIKPLCFRSFDESA